jgi:excisionase family DNA binding protein
MSGRPGYLRAQAVADRLGVTVRTVRRWIADKTIPSIKVGGTRFIAEEDLARALGGGVADLATDDDG